MQIEVAEREGFEPSIPFWSMHAFQACAFNHSAISPTLIRLPPVRSETDRLPYFTSPWQRQAHSTFVPDPDSPGLRIPLFHGPTAFSRGAMDRKKT